MSTWMDSRTESRWIMACGQSATSSWRATKSCGRLHSHTRRGPTICHKTFQQRQPLCPGTTSKEDARKVSQTSPWRHPPAQDPCTSDNAVTSEVLLEKGSIKWSRIGQPLGSLCSRVSDDVCAALECQLVST
mmetsp:Transcript_39842/g.89327  ORF Transcript_39842/g.89327 Transcript_39842/m.89327 type:complete len:132 (-) Transcript_39842:29-424(-)